MSPNWRRLRRLKGVLGLTTLLAYQALRFILIAVFSFPVALIYVISALLLDPSIPASSKHHLPQLVIDRFNQVFQYSVTLAILLSVCVLGLVLLKSLRERLLSGKAGTAGTDTQGLQG
jgi:ABC-type multidrug transport system fused ATPase/permease subunit